MEIDNSNWTAFTYWMGVFFGATITLQISAMIAERRHKRALHGRMHKLENKQREQSNSIHLLKNWKDQTLTRKESAGLTA